MHRDTVRRYVAARFDAGLRKRLDPSDVVQEVMAEAARRLDDYAADPKLPFSLWLRRIAQDRLADAVRRHRGAERRSVEREETAGRGGPGSATSAYDLSRRIAAAGLTPAAALLRRELLENFQAALARLEPDDREIVLMRHAERLTNQEAAALLGLSEPAAAMRHLRALRKLKPLLHDPGSSVR